MSTHSRPPQPIFEKGEFNIDTTGQLGDADNADLCTGISCSIDKLFWIVQAHIQN